MTRHRFNLRSIFLVVSLSAILIAMGSGNTYGLALLFVVAAIIAVLGLPVLVLAFFIAEPLRIWTTRRKSNARETDAPHS